MSQEQRVIVFIIFVFGVLMLSQRIWQPQPLPKGTTPSGVVEGGDDASTTGTQTAQAPTRDDLRQPDVDVPVKDDTLEDIYAQMEPGEKIVVHTNVYEITFDTRGARPASWRIIAPNLMEKDEETGISHPIEMIPQHAVENPEMDLPLEVSFKELGRKTYPKFNRLAYDCKLTTDAKGVATLRCVSPEIDGLRLTKTYRIPWDSFLVDLNLEMTNLDQGSHPRDIHDGIDSDDDGDLDLFWGLGLRWGPGIGQYSAKNKGRMSMRNGLSGAMATDSEVVNITPNDGPPLVKAGPAQWIALRNKYFMAALIPDDESTKIAAVTAVQFNRNALSESLEKAQSPPHTIIAYGEPFKLGPGDSATANYRVFVGPMKTEVLAETGYDLNRVMFHTSWGWFRALILGLMWLLTTLYGWCHNYGIAIILLTVVVKIITYPLTHKSMKLNAKTQMEMAKIKPELTAINEKYKDDFQGKNKATMEVYKTHGINPMAPLRGCLPLMLQMPIFIALWRLLDASVDIRGVPFLWIVDLSHPDRLFTLPFALPFLGQDFNLLPILMAITTVATQLMSATQISDPNQKMMLYMMPIMMLFMLYKFSSGLFIYWITSNIWQMVHQYVTTRLLKTHQAHAPPAK